MRGCATARDSGGIGEVLSATVNRPLAALRVIFSTGRKADVLGTEIDRAHETLANRVDTFLIQLRDIVEARVLAKGEAFAFFRRLLNYSRRDDDPARLKHDIFLDYFLCDETLECHRNHLRLNDRYIKILTLKDPPAQTFANLLKGLLEIPSNFIVATEWRREDNHAARKHIQSARRHHHNSKYSLLNYILTPTDRHPPAPSQMLLDESAEAFVGDLGAGLREMEDEATNGYTNGDTLPTRSRLGPKTAMPRTCTICDHPQRKAIDAALCWAVLSNYFA